MGPTLHHGGRDRLARPGHQGETGCSGGDGRGIGRAHLHIGQNFTAGHALSMGKARSFECSGARLQERMGA
jgi:hypothetical protein